jgi:hypothetical protein
MQMRIRIVTLALLAGVGSAFAGASSQNFSNPPPDPATQSMSRSEAKRWVLDRCLLSQARLQGKTREEVRSACSCYSSRTVDGMTKAEFQNFREKSYFDDTTREKALSNIDACKLKRPI